MPNVFQQVTKVIVELPIRYDDEDMAYDFPLRVDDMWTATIDIKTGQIENWKAGVSGDFYLKVVDMGSYYLVDSEDNVLKSIEQDYVPNELINGEWGDYVDFKIDENGLITNWLKSPSFKDFE